MKIYLYNENCCARVRLYGVDVKNLFLTNGAVLCEKEEEADYIIVNTCSFLKTKEDYFLSFLNEIYKRKQKKQVIMVVGCLGSVNRTAIEAIGTDILIFARDLSEIKEYFHFKEDIKTIATHISEPETAKSKAVNFLNEHFLHDKNIDFRLKKDSVCYIQISTGCLGKCTYCSEKFITKLKSRPIPEVIEAVNDGIKRGFKLFSLSSDDASAYGRDLGYRLDDLLSELVKIREDILFIIPEFNPNGITDKTIELLKDKRFLYITVPIQSGSNRILSVMKRPYQIGSVIDKIKQIKSVNPDLMINSHLIVGFPGETEDDFEKTRDLVKSGLLDRIKVFKYSSRPGTEAAEITEGIVSEEEKERRRKTLLSDLFYTNLKKGSVTNIILNTEQIKK